MLRVPSITWMVPTPVAHLQVISAAVAARVRPTQMRTRAAGVAAAPVRLVRLRPRVIGIASEAGGEGGVSAGLAATTTAVARRWHVRGGGARRQEVLKGEEVQAGRRGDKRERWAIEELLGVRRVRGRGRGLEVRLREAGLDVPARLLSREEAWGLAHASEQHTAVDDEMLDEEADWRPAEPPHMREANAHAECRAC